MNKARQNLYWLMRNHNFLHELDVVTVKKVNEYDEGEYLWCHSAE
jgi:hypothetical protein